MDDFFDGWIEWKRPCLHSNWALQTKSNPFPPETGRLGSYLFQVIALSHFLAYRSSGSEEEFKDRLRQRLEASRLSLRTLLKMYGAVPASVRGGNGDAYNAHNAYAPYPGGSDTGMGFSYLRMIHVASALPLTARVGCFALLWVWVIWMSYRYAFVGSMIVCTWWCSRCYEATG